MDPSAQLFFGERIKKHYMCVRIPRHGYILEDGTFVSYERMTDDLQGLSDKFLNVYLAGLSVFKDGDFKLI
jgi:hypothetical protein